MKTTRFKVGDRVRPRPEWREDPNRVPSGRIVRIESWGDCGAIHVEGERRAFAGYVFEHALEEASMSKQRRKVTGLVVFSGELDPDVEGATAELRQHGFEVVRMPEKFRRLLLHPRDDFAEVAKTVRLSSDDWEKLTAAEQKILNEIWDEARKIAARYGAEVDSFGPAQPGEQPFEVEFGELAKDDAKLAAEIEKIDSDMMMGVERARAWGRL